MMGGSVAHEFMFLNHNGEDELVLCDECGYRANQEVAECIYAQPEKEDLLWLKEQGVTDIINFRTKNSIF